MSGYWTDKHVLVTGGAGFLGSSVLAGLKSRQPAKVTAPTSDEVDLRDRAQTQEMFKAHSPDLVIHLAAKVGGIGANRESPSDLYIDNLLMGTFVLDSALQAGTHKTVMLGTICSYPKFTPVPFQETSLWQGYPEETNAPYGIAKLAQLTQMQANRDQHGQSAIYLMPTNLYGPGDKFNTAVSHVIPALIKKCVEAQEAGAGHIDVWGTGSATREFLYVDDAAEGVLLAAEHYDGREPVNLGTDEEMPIRSLVEIITELVGFTGEVRWDSSKPDGQPRRRVDPGVAKAEFGFEARVDFREGLQRTIDWYRANRELAESRVN